MASYHRVLKLFHRTVDDRTLECNYDIHPWDVSVNNKQWGGKIRLIGFLDVFFLISYSGDNRFEDGIIIYKEDNAIRKILEEAKVKAEDIGLKQVNEQGADTEKKSPPKYFNSENPEREFIVKSLGHRISLKTTYDPSWLTRYEIKITKSADAAWKRRVRRGLTQHSTFQLGQDLVRLGFISQADLIAELTSRFLVGGVAEDAIRKYMGSLAGGRSESSGLSNEKI